MAALIFAVASSAAQAQAQPRCPNPIAIVRAGDTAAGPSAVAGALLDPTCTNIEKIERATKENIEQAPKTIGTQPGIVVVATTGFTGALLNRLDTVHGQAEAAGVVVTLGSDGLMGLGMGSKTRPQQTGYSSQTSPLTVYAMGTFGGGRRSDLPDMVGFSYESTSGTVGLEYRVSRNLIVGLAANHTTAGADLSNSATVDIEAVQFAAYLSYATKLWFIDALVGYGRHDLDMARPGNGSLLRSSPDGDVFAAAIRGGYLFELGMVRVGPIAGLTFVRSHLDGFTETGDPQLALTVASQKIDATTASVGVRFLAPFVASGKVVIPYLNITLEHQLGESTRSLSASFAATPPQGPVFSSVPNFDTPTYGKVEGGVTFQLGANLSATINGASTFARDEGNDYRISTGLNYRF